MSGEPLLALGKCPKTYRRPWFAQKIIDNILLRAVFFASVEFDKNLLRGGSLGVLPVSLSFFVTM